MAEKISPGMQQYLDIKKDYPDAFLLFRMGDFYELFYDDAVNAAQILELTLTSRNKNSEHPVPMAGVPHHAVQDYIDKLVELGYKVAIADQMEDPKQAVGIVKRAVTQVVTPGTAIDTNNRADNNFLVAIDRAQSGFALAYVDLSTGEFKVTELADFSAAVGEIASLKAREVLLTCDLTEAERMVLAKQMNLLLSEQLDFDEKWSLADLSNLTEAEQAVSSKLLAYVNRTQMRDLSHLQEPEHYEIADFLQMDFATKSSLELTNNKREGKKHGTLYGLLDATKTAMGTRLLRAWIERPLLKRQAIETRQEIVQIFLDNFFERADLIEALKGVYDLERLASRVSFGKALPVDFLQLANSLSNVPAIKNVLNSLHEGVLSNLTEKLDDIPELSNLIEAAIDPAAMRVISEGGIIRAGYNAQLDKYREALSNGASWIAELESKEKKKTKISTLRIDYNRKDGYYFHVTQSQLGSVPDYFFRKATLKNSERFGSKELTEIEEIMLEARDKSSILEYNLFQEVRTEVEQYISRLQSLAKTIATIDCLQALATVAEKQGYVRPTFTEKHEVKIKKGRHAVVEAVMAAQEYVPNDIELPEKTNIQLITGPNMSGKSTYMRQFALSVIMAQLGSFVAAESAELPVFDAIFTRIGASDNLISGESTFMVEMSEANFAIQHATPNSLIIFDELGRGTATYDGMALAQAIIEYIHEHIGAKTLFATHYHELTELAKTLSNLTNVHVATLEQNGDVTFLHKITSGPADKSYGIHVAKIAGLPPKLLERADLILQKLENQPLSANQALEVNESEQLSLFNLDVSNSAVIDKLQAINVDNMTAREALNFLWELKDLL